mgnify:CR=1 FL=1
MRGAPRFGTITESELGAALGLQSGRVAAIGAYAAQVFQKAGKLVEAQRIEQRTRFDLEMLGELGFCKGIENYSRHMSGRNPGGGTCAATSITTTTPHPRQPHAGHLPGNFTPSSPVRPGHTPGLNASDH